MLRPDGDVGDTRGGVRHHSAWTTTMTSPLDTMTTAVLALTERLEDLADLLDDTSDFDYRWTPPGGVSGSVGAHLRHILDHVNALLAVDRTGGITYDHRQRDTALEQSRLVAIAALGRAATDLRARLNYWAERPLALQTIVRRGGPLVPVSTSLARELVFVLQHTIHHQALIALLLNQRGMELPSQFGYAPSTPMRAAS
jgi:uncharacterized damage-inducible protein DinB